MLIVDCRQPSTLDNQQSEDQPDLPADFVEGFHVAEGVGFADGGGFAVEYGGGEVVGLERVELGAGVDEPRLARRTRGRAGGEVHPWWSRARDGVGGLLRRRFPRDG